VLVGETDGGGAGRRVCRKLGFDTDHLVGAGEHERWHIETIALAALSLFMPFSQSITLTPFWAPPASAARALR
jgi:hypothetical protein